MYHNIIGCHKDTRSPLLFCVIVESLLNCAKAQSLIISFQLSMYSWVVPILTVCLELISVVLASEIGDLDHLRPGDRIRPPNGDLTDLSCLGGGRVRWGRRHR